MNHGVRHTELDYGLDTAKLKGAGRLTTNERNAMERPGTGRIRPCTL